MFVEKSQLHLPRPQVHQSIVIDKVINAVYEKVPVAEYLSRVLILTETIRDL
jgi:hypothetical protein